MKIMCFTFQIELQKLINFLIDSLTYCDAPVYKEGEWHLVLGSDHSGGTAVGSVHQWTLANETCAASLWRSRLRLWLWLRRPRRLPLRYRWSPPGRRPRRWSSRSSSSSRWWQQPRHLRSRLLLPTAPPSRTPHRLPPSPRFSSPLSRSRPPRVNLARVASRQNPPSSQAAEFSVETVFWWTSLGRADDETVVPPCSRWS